MRFCIVIPIVNAIMNFLKYDFPRIPLPQDIEQFRTLVALGQQLIDWHLLEDMIATTEVAPTRRVELRASHRFEGEGDGVVSKDTVCG